MTLLFNVLTSWEDQPNIFLSLHAPPLQMSGAERCHVPCQPQALPILMEASSHENADLRQCSVYGLGVLAEKVRERQRPGRICGVRQCR